MKKTGFSLFVVAGIAICISSCRPEKMVTAVVPLAPVKIDESVYVFKNNPHQLLLLNDTTLVLCFSHELVFYHTRTGKLLRVFDIRKINTDSIHFARYKKQDSGRSYFSVRHDSTLGISLEPVIHSMNSSEDHLDFIFYAAIGYKKNVHEIPAEELNKRPDIAAAIAAEQISETNIIENKTMLGRLTADNRLAETALLIGPAEPKTNPLFLSNAAAGFIIHDGVFYTPGVVTHHLPEFEYTYTPRDSAVLQGACRIDNGMLETEKILLATHHIRGYKQTLETQLKNKCYRVWNDTVLVNAEFGLYSLPDARPYYFQFADTTGEIRNRAFARCNNAFAYLSSRKNPADTTKWQQVLRVVDCTTNARLFFAPVNKSSDVAVWENTFYTITSDEEHYYINAFETK